MTTMTKQTLQALGLTDEDVLNRLTEKLVDRFVDDESSFASKFQDRIEKAIKTQVDVEIDKALAAHVIPGVNKMIEDICLVETNKWGEKIGTKLTFIEYLTQRVDAYIREPVNYQGKAKGEDSYSWSASTTRISHSIHEYLKYSIDKAMKQALEKANSSIKVGLEEACKMAINGIKISVDTKVQS